MKRLTGLMLVVAAASAQAELVDRVAAVVNDDVVALSEVEARAAPELAALHNAPADRRAALRDEALRHALDALIGEKLMESQIRDLAIEVTDSEIDLSVEDVKKQNGISGEQFEHLLAQEGYTMATYRSFMRKHLARMKLVNLKVRSQVKVADEDLKAEYARWAHDEANDFEVHARHILVQVSQKASPEEVEAARKKAAALALRARQPGADFAQLAKETSEGPSRDDGGDLGFFRRGVMEADFDRAAFATPEHGVSDPVRTKFGWHVIYIEEKRALAVPPFDEVKDQLREKLLRTQMDKYTEKYLQELRRDALVDVKL